MELFNTVMIVKSLNSLLLNRTGKLVEIVEDADGEMSYSVRLDNNAVIHNLYVEQLERIS